MKDSEKPHVSVLMGVRYLQKDLNRLSCAVESVLSQTYRELELIVCENGSTPEARQMLARYAQDDARVRLVDGAGAMTLGEKLNRCLACAVGAFVARQDDDDISEPDRIEKQVAFLEQNPEISFVGCNVKLIQDGSFVGERSFPEKPQVADFFFVQPFIHPTLVFRAEAMTRVGGYCPGKQCDGCEDYDLLLRLYEIGLVGANLQEPLFQYRLPDRGKTKRTFAMRCREVQVRWKHFRALGVLPGALPYVIKPVVVGLLPTQLLEEIKLRAYAGSRKGNGAE